jgi:hypothetical protein
VIEAKIVAEDEAADEEPGSEATAEDDPDADSASVAEPS